MYTGPFRIVPQCSKKSYKIKESHINSKSPIFSLAPVNVNIEGQLQ